MSERYEPHPAQPACAYVLPALISAVLLWGASTPAVYAQDETPKPTEVTVTQDQTLGTLTVKVVEAATGKPVSDAVVRIDGPKLDTSKTERSDYFGLAVFKDIPEGPYDVYFSSTRYRIDPKPKKADDVIAKTEVKAKQNSILELKVAPAIDAEGTFVGVVSILNPDEFGTVTRRTARDIADMPLTGANPQSLPNVLRSVPGIVPDSINQSHPRGENSVVAATYVDGILLPQTLAGRANAFLNPRNMRSVTVRTGGFAAEYGGGSGAIYDVRMREPDLDRPTIETGLNLGTFDTRQIYFNFGSTLAVVRRRRGQAPMDTGRRIRYIFGFDSRYTNNALETPQSGDQTAFNDGSSELFFGKVALDLKPGTQIGVLFNLSSGRTNIAQRTGVDVPPQFGQGFGFTGLSLRNSGLRSQRDLNQRLRQKDNNSLVALKYSTTTKTGMVMDFALGATQSTQTYINVGTQNNRFITFPGDSSLEYIPATGNDTSVVFLQADVTPLTVARVHNLKFGASFQFFEGDDAYQYDPQSGAALATLRALDPRLAPAGPAFVSPVVFANRSGFYLTAYAQDTFRLRTRKNSDVNLLYFNVGFRLDSYSQRIETQENQQGQKTNLRDITNTEISPRLNIVFDMTNPNNRILKQPTLIRVSYNRMFAHPNFGQGNFLAFQPGSQGNIPVGPARPQTVDQYDISVERQLARDKSLRLAIYSKDLRNTLAARQLIEGMQQGFLTIQNLGNGTAEGYELYFELKPPRDRNTGQEIPGFYGYAGISSSEAAPNGRFTTNNLGLPFGQVRYDHDQETAFTLGAAYRLKDGATAGLAVYAGSGLYSSVLSLQGSPVGASGRESFNIVDLRYNTGPRFLNKRVAMQVDVENLTDSRARLNFRNSIGGTRFQQGRRIVLSATGRF